MYREEHGVVSFILDDDNCDCKSTLNAGHAMCHGGFSSSYGTENVYGVGLLNENGCGPGKGPSETNSLFMYYKGRYFPRVGGTLNFSAYVGWDTASTLYPKKYQEFQTPLKNI